MTVDWQDGELVSAYEQLDGFTERTVGLPVLFEELRLSASDVRTVLDYGCGPGETAELMARRFGVRVEAADTSAAMLEVARRRRSHPLIHYRRLDGDLLSELPTGSLDAAASSFVFANIGDRGELLRIARAVHRLLRPGGRYVVMDSNPDETGTRFASFQVGDSGRRYAEGEQRRVELFRVDGSALELVDYHWPVATYRHVLGGAGFERVTVRTPILDRRPEIVEGQRAPLILVTAEKP